MEKSVKRRLFMTGVFVVLMAAPFIVRSIRKTTLLPWAKTYEVKIDPSVVPSGKIDVFREKLLFQPLALPENVIQQWTLNAAVSNDNQFLFVSYCFGNDYQSQICCAPLREGMPESFVKLMTFDPQSAILGLGCSSFNESGSGRLSYHLSRFNREKESANLALFCAPLQKNELTPESFSDPVLLTESDIRMKDLTEHLNNISRMNHCHLNEQPSFIYRNISGSLLCKADYQKAGSDPISILRQFASKEMEKAGECCSLNTNLFYDGKTVSYLEAPVLEQEADQKYYD